jgi:Holliday junction resolvase RusA-like endonuclease
MRGLSPTINDGQPFTAETIEIILDLPFPPSANRIWRSRHYSPRPYRSEEYISWIEHADMAVMAARAFPKRKIIGPFEAAILLSDLAGRGDGDNRIKALLDWCQSRDIVRNDSDCRRGSWEWVELARAPKGCRITLRSLHG